MTTTGDRVLCRAVKIYTRKGDDGTTSLWYGGRVDKNDARTEAYGSLDEADVRAGGRAGAGERPRVHADLLRLQNDLFVAGAELATAPEARERLEAGVSRLDDGHGRAGSSRRSTTTWARSTCRPSS